MFSLIALNNRVLSDLHRFLSGCECSYLDHGINISDLSYVWGEKKGGVGKQSYSVSSSSGSAEKNVGIGRWECSSREGVGPAAWAATDQVAERGWGGAYIHETLTVAEDNLTAGLLDVD